MNNVVPFPSAQVGTMDTRKIESAHLRRIIAEGRVALSADDVPLVAVRVDGFITRLAGNRGRRGVTEICARIWPGDDNPARRRPELRATKRPKTLERYVKRIADAAGVSEDDLLLEAFRGTRIDAAVTHQLRGADDEPELEEFWATLSTTFHALAGAVVRAERLEEHAERMVALRGAYDLAADVIRPVSAGRLLDRPLANWNNHWSEFPPIPSVVLFTEPKSVTVERELMVRDTGQVIPVRMTILREVRLAIGPADSVLVPAPLFEFRSVLQLVGPQGSLRIRCPWLCFDEDEVEVQIDGAWHMADIPFGGSDLDDMSGPYDQSAAFGEDWKLLKETRKGCFPALLEAPLQYGHNYIVWRPVTADTCREVLLRPRSEITPGPFKAEPAAGRPETFCPPGSLAEVIEAALHVDGPDGLAARLRAEAARMAALVRGWHAARAAAAEAVHRDLRASWEGWS